MTALIGRPTGTIYSSANGPITSPADASNIVFGGITYEVQRVPAYYALVNVGNYDFRFQVRGGDYAASVDQDHLRDRSELVPTVATDYPYGTTQWISFDRKIYAYVQTDDSIMGQIHSQPGGNGPPCTIRINSSLQEAVQLAYKEPTHGVRYVNPDGTPSTTPVDVWTGGTIVLNAWHHWVIQFKAGDPGLCNVWRDGVQIVTYAGLMGYTAGTDVTRFQFGVYSAGLSPTGGEATARAAEFRNIVNGTTPLPPT